MALPLKTTIADLDALSGFLKTQVGFTTLDKIKSTIDKKHADPRKIEACSFIGFLERDGNNVKLSDAGKSYASATDESAKSAALRKCLLTVELYVDTLHWMHFSNKPEPTRTDVGNYWHDNQSDKLRGAKNAALTDAVIFFFRLAGASGFGQFIPAGNNRPESYFKGDPTELENIATSPQVGTDASPNDENLTGTEKGGNAAPRDPRSTNGNGPDQDNHQRVPNPQIRVDASPAVHVNIEIHIAADATAQTVEEIFRNMRKYVLNSPGSNE